MTGRVCIICGGSLRKVFSGGVALECVECLTLLPERTYCEIRRLHEAARNLINAADHTKGTGEITVSQGAVDALRAALDARSQEDSDK